MIPVDVMELARTGPVHFMGIGGAGMYPLAELMVRSGGRVTGCDVRQGPITERLTALGVEVSSGHDPSHVEGAVAVVATAAVPPTHPELVRARERGIPVVKRAQALGDVVNQGRVVAVAGTHGKTSTTAMATEILAAGGLDPTGFVGGSVTGWDGNLRLGNSDLFVVEADEFDRSFHALEPDAAVITSLEADHLDIYADLNGVRAAFREFLSRIRPGARVAICGDDGEASRLLTALPASGYTYGLSAGSQLQGTDIRHTADATSCRVFEEGADRGTIRVRVPGVHNLRNALAASAMARHLGVDWGAIREGLESFRGVGRRFQRLGEVGGVTIVDDYAHHPTEIEVTLAATRAVYPGSRLIAVFQPHLFTRTRDFASDFGHALSGADRVYVSDVYPAREEPIEGVSGELVANAVSGGSRPVEVTYLPALGAVEEALLDDLAPGDVVVVMGAGSIEGLAPALLKRLEASHA